ncbi:hypothetical protein F1188_12890 [Roseospira marina]|uniref:Uncharacterized protein n=1 Tax=Roseospira marina TaxID=140057 RepID=A0A5M6IC16_9PROT|nr:hypothetical protein [Roseospira marina]KAA5605168.1 hypothetical protein F1188_12890 [Roseospira marina]MBB4314925.1 hypothetical protein [Roseospira marina]MBB5087925.1 hypothetical protein [Roseospira marina]
MTHPRSAPVGPRRTARMKGAALGASSALMAALMAALTATGPAVAQDRTALHVRPVPVMDTQGFGRPLVAYTVMVPVQWQEQGGVQWDPANACNRSGYNFSWKAGLPDDSAGVAILPTITWTSQPGGPCPQLQIGSARDLLTQYVGRLIPNARVLDFRPRPDLIRDLQALVYRENASGLSYETTVDAGELLIAFTDERGRDMRASIAATAMLWRITLAGMSGMPGMTVSGGSSMPGFVAAAQAGQLDLRMAEMIRKSIRPGPEWSREIARHHAVLNRQNAQHSSRMAEITSQTNREISEIISQGYSDREAIRDRGHREQIEAIRGVETYVDPLNGGTVQLDNSYGHAWQLSDGTYVLTDDAAFDPRRALGIDGRPLHAAR